MITLYKLAKEIGVAYPTLFKRFKNSDMYGIVNKDETGKLLINEEFASVIRSWYTKPEYVQSTIPDNALGNENYMELKAKNEALESRVRELTDELVSLNKKTLELTQSAHILLGMEQQNKVKMIEPETKKGFWDFFKKKKVT